MTELVLTDDMGDEIRFDRSYSPNEFLIFVYSDQDNGESTTQINLNENMTRQVVTYLTTQLSEFGVGSVDLDELLSEDRTTNVRDTWNRIAFESAAALEAGVTFRYAKGDRQQTIESRTLSQVYDVREVKGHIVVTGFDPDRDDVRAYRLDRIKGTVSVDL